MSDERGPNYRYRLARANRELFSARPGRKTDRVVGSRRASHDMPDVSVSMILPWDKSVKPGETFGLISLVLERIGSSDHATITGKNREWVIGQASTFLRHMEIPRLQAVLRRADEPGPTLSGPVRKGYQRTLWINAKGLDYLEKDERGVLGLRMLSLFPEGV